MRNEKVVFKTALSTVSGMTVCICHWAKAWEGGDPQMPEVRRSAIGTKFIWARCFSGPEWVKITLICAQPPNEKGKL